MARACDIVRYGRAVADVTFPQPNVTGVGALEVAAFVESLVGMVNQKEKLRDWRFSELAVPERLDPRLLSVEEASAVRGACVSELIGADAGTQKVVKTMSL